MIKVKLIKILFILLLLNIIQFTFALNLKIVWWNVHNFFDTIDDPDKEDNILSIEEYNEKLFLVSEKIKKINPDIIGFTEIENINVLKDIALKSGYPYYYLEEGNDPRGIDVGLISKYKLDQYISNKNRIIPYDENPNYKFSRDLTVAELTIDGKKLYILTTHLKAMTKNDKKSNKKRKAQIFGILDIIEEIYNKDKEPDIIIMGDLNSYRHSEFLNILEKSGLIIMNYFYNEKNIYTYINKKDLDYFIINENLKRKIKFKNLKSFNKKEFEKISDHYPLLLKIKF